MACQDISRKKNLLGTVFCRIYQGNKRKIRIGLGGLISEWVYIVNWIIFSLTRWAYNWDFTVSIFQHYFNNTRIQQLFYSGKQLRNYNFDPPANSLKANLWGGY